MLCSLEQVLQVSLHNPHPAGDGPRGRGTALTVLAAVAGVAGRAQAGSRGAVAARVVRAVGTELLAAQAPATVRASWRAAGERTDKDGDHRRKREASLCWCTDRFVLLVRVRAPGKAQAPVWQHAATSEDNLAWFVLWTACEPC